MTSVVAPTTLEINVSGRRSRRPTMLALIFVAVTLTGCDAIKQKLGLEDPASKAEKDSADGKAVGGACRQSGRAIEDCYAVYSWLPRASVYEGWRDMDAYMRDNKLETVTPQLPPVSAPGAKKKAAKTKSTENGEGSTEESANAAKSEAPSEEKKSEH